MQHYIGATVFALLVNMPEKRIVKGLYEVGMAYAKILARLILVADKLTSGLTFRGENHENNEESSGNDGSGRCNDSCC
ncbi:MAG: hypothetical protein R3E73_09815 [Porticoccaceae bacterium]